MSPISNSRIRKLVIQEHYRTSLIEQLYEQAAPAPTDPAAPTPPADPAAAPPAPPADPAAAPPMPPADPTAAIPAAPGAPPPPPVPAAPGAPAPTTAPAPGAPAAGDAAKKKAEAPNPEKEPVKSHVNKALMKATTAAANASGAIAVESLRRRSLRFLVEQATEDPKIDLGVYASEIARLINNYTSLIDVKKNVIDQAEEYLDSEFPAASESLKKQFRDLLRKDYHISLERPEPLPDSYAVGAKSGGGGGAA